MAAELIRTTAAECIQALDLILRMRFVDALAPASRTCGPLRGSRNRTESSTPIRSATQSEVQRDPRGVRWKLQKMGAISLLSL
jgi:hypothetical protein